jgi:hypothetical protein
MTVLSPQAVSPSDRRTESRASYPREAILCLDHGLWRVSLRDISARGLGVLLPRELAPASRLIIELFSTTGQFWHRKSVEVVHVTDFDGATWLVGSIFRQEFSAEELRALIG